MKKQPERTAQTRARLIEAFWTVGETHGLSHVSVSGVAKTADVNRSTFYVYFDDIPSLLREAEQEIISEIKQRLWSQLAIPEKIDSQQFTARAVAVFEQYGDRLFFLLGEHGDPNFSRKLRKEALETLPNLLPDTSALQDQEYVLAFLSAAFIGVLQYWHEGGRKISVEALSKIVQRLGMNAIRNW